MPEERRNVHVCELIWLTVIGRNVIILAVLLIWLIECWFILEQASEGGMHFRWVDLKALSDACPRLEFLAIP